MTESRIVLKSGGKTKKGRSRIKNQDSFVVDNIFGVFIVADGLGGHSGGEFASKIVCKSIHQTIQLALAHSIKNMLDIPTLMNEAIQQAHHQLTLIQSEYKNLNNMGSTTAVVVWEPDLTLHVVNIGDSRVYHQRVNTIEIVTIDHLERKNLLTQAIGVKINEGAHYRKLTIKPEEKVLLCTNGLSDFLELQEIHKLILSSDETTLICKNLIRRAIKAGTTDDTTAVLVTVEFSSLSDDEFAKHQMIRQWIIESISGDTHAFGKLYSTVEKPLMAFILSKCRYSKNDPEVEEIFQKCWIRIFEKLITYNPEYSFLGFAFIWANFAIKEFYTWKKGSDKFRNLSENDQKEISNIDYYPVSDDYYNWLEILFTCKKLPHEIITFGFIKLCEYSIEEVLDQLSSSSLNDLLTRLMNEYIMQSRIQSKLLEPFFNLLFKKLILPVNELLQHEPKELYRDILDRITGQTILSDYFGSNKNHSISLWLNRVKNACLKNYQLKENEIRKSPQ